MQAGAAAWFTVNGCPPTLSVAERAEPVFACTNSETDPGPLPVPAPLIVIHGGAPVVDHAHPFAVLTPTETGPPAAEMEWLVGASE